jgi:hypothetical protein
MLVRLWRYAILIPVGNEEDGADRGSFAAWRGPVPS